MCVCKCGGVRVDNAINIGIILGIYAFKNHKKLSTCTLDGYNII